MWSTVTLARLNSAWFSFANRVNPDQTALIGVKHWFSFMKPSSKIPNPEQWTNPNTKMNESMSESQNKKD